MVHIPCQLILVRMKIVHDFTIPHAKLIAALLNASAGHVHLHNKVGN